MISYESPSLFICEFSNDLQMNGSPCLPWLLDLPKNEKGYRGCRDVTTTHLLHHNHFVLSRIRQTDKSTINFHDCSITRSSFKSDVSNKSQKRFSFQLSTSIISRLIISSHKKSFFQSFTYISNKYTYKRKRER